MSGRRMLLAGSQVLVVGTLLAVIYFTLLKPGDDSSLFGVDAPQQSPRVAQEPKDDDRVADRDRNRGRPGGRDERLRRGTFVGFGGPPPGGFAGGPGGAPGGGPGGGGPGEDEPSDDGDSPGADQYSSTLARLEAMLDPGQ